MATERYDVVIIGSGAGGGTLAWRLAATGKRILLLERGAWLPREKENWNSQAVFRQQRYRAAEIWHDGDGRPFHPSIHYWVGGNTKMYGSVLLRFRESDFESIEHRGGISPAWPIRYEDLAPYYLQAERLYQAHGHRGEDPTEPPETESYPFAGLMHEPRIQELSEKLQAVGRRPFHLPVGLRLNEAHRRGSPCIRCETCDGFPCLVNGKADAQVICVEPALAHPNVELRTGCHVERLETDASGNEIKEVVYRHDGALYSVRGDLVVLSAGAINSAALLLRSANPAHPDGLANRSGVVGRYYMCHNNGAFIAISKQRNPTRFQKTLGLNDYYFGDEDWNYPMGHIQMLGKLDSEMLREAAPRIVPGAALDAMAHYSFDFWLTGEDLPSWDNRVLVDRDDGIRIHYMENNVEGFRRLQAKLQSLLNAIGCCDSGLIPCSAYLGKKIPIAGTAHQCGTVRFGTSPRSSALDVHCRAHDIDNLYVVDSSFFVSSAAVNPALTIIANALRVGDHLATRLR